MDGPHYLQPSQDLNMERLDLRRLTGTVAKAALYVASIQCIANRPTGICRIFHGPDLPCSADTQYLREHSYKTSMSDVDGAVQGSHGAGPDDKICGYSR